MKSSLAKFVVGAGLVAIGWIAGSLRIPYVEDLKLLLAGAVSTLVIVIGGLMIWRGVFQTGVVSKRTSSFATVIIVAVLLAFSYQIIKGRSTIKTQKQELYKLEGQLAQLRSNYDRYDWTIEEDVISDILAEVRAAGASKLDSSLVNRIVRTTQLLYPKPMLNRLGNSDKLYSVGRGHLLTQLLALGIHEASLAEIKTQGNFTQSYLSGANLTGYDLSSIDLSQSDLTNTTFANANLTRTVLAHCAMRRSDLKGANLSKADLRNADVSWSNLDNALCDSAYMNGINLQSAQLNDAQLTHVELKYANLTFATLHQASLAHSNLVWTDLARARLTKVNLTNGIISKANFREADLTGVILDSAETHQQWLAELIEHRTIGADPILHAYSILPDTSKQGNLRFLLIK